MRSSGSTSAEILISVAHTGAFRRMDTVRVGEGRTKEISENPIKFRGQAAPVATFSFISANILTSEAQTTAFGGMQAIK